MEWERSFEFKVAMIKQQGIKTLEILTKSSEMFHFFPLLSGRTSADFYQRPKGAHNRVMQRKILFPFLCEPQKLLSHNYYGNSVNKPSFLHYIGAKRSQRLLSCRKPEPESTSRTRIYYTGYNRCPQSRSLPDCNKGNIQSSTGK